MKNTFIVVVLIVLAFVSLCYVIVQAREDVDVNTQANGVTTSMNGNTSTSFGGSISSTSASKESRSVSGSGD